MIARPRYPHPRPESDSALGELKAGAGRFARRMRALLLCLHMEPHGGEMLARAGFERFVAAEDRDYNPIRIMAKRAEQVSLL